jgi:hypothetical protein
MYRIDDQIMKGIDGAYFGMDYIDILLSLHPELVRSHPEPEFVPRIYGFRINAAAQATEAEEPPPE